MQILLASAKIMNAATSVDIPMKSKPKFQEQAGLFALELSSWDINRLMKELKCSQAIALENQQRYQSFWNEEELLPSILAYYGQAYKYLKADNFSQDDFAFAQDHLFITSFLYGLLRPLDMIHPYRMEGKVRLDATKGMNLFAFWKTYLTNMLIEAVKANDGILIHLATEEFEHLFDWKRVCQEVKVIQPLFYVDKGDTIKMLSVHAKSCRGAMTRFIIQNRIDQPSDIFNFELNGFRYAPNYGDELHPHFIKI